MSLERYSFVEEDSNFRYEFYSIGPKGRILKVVQYDRYEEAGEEVYNVGFGDAEEEEAGGINDQRISNNGDRDKVLGTVVATAIHFMKKHPKAILFAEGSTASRTRLYQMGISKVWNEVALVLVIQGYIGGEWEPFQQGRNYEAFLISRK